jgi:hypothetical protein
VSNTWRQSSSTIKERQWRRSGKLNCSICPTITPAATSCCSNGVIALFVFVYFFLSSKWSRPCKVLKTTDVHFVDTFKFLDSGSAWRLTSCIWHTIQLSRPSSLSFFYIYGNHSIFLLVHCSASFLSTSWLCVCEFALIMNIS